MELNYYSNLANRIHDIAKDKGFWDGNPDPFQKIMLIISEIGEALEADRHGKWFREIYTKESIESGNINTFELYCKNTFEDEIADVLIRILDFMQYNKIRIPPDGAIEMEFDEVRFSDNVGRELYNITSSLIKCVNGQFEFGFLLCLIWNFSKHFGIDLIWHVERKIEYNESRPRLHNKKY